MCVAAALSGCATPLQHTTHEKKYTRGKCRKLFSSPKNTMRIITPMWMYGFNSRARVRQTRVRFWDALNYESANYMQHLNAFMQSEGRRYHDLLIASDQVLPRKAPGSPEDGLDGWS